MYGDRPQRDGERRPYGDRDSRPQRDGERRPYGDRDSRPQRDGERRSYGDRDSRGGERRIGGSRDDRRFEGGDRTNSRPPESDRVRDPELPEEITARDLPSAARNELKTLSKENAERVARHLAMAARTLDEDPAHAHEHAQAAVRHAGRVAVARETLGITAYTVGDFALALRELRTYRRITGRDDLIAVIVDSERGLGRPERALEEGRGVDRAALPTAVRVELAIAMSGARLDLGETQLALVELDIPELDPDTAYEWSPGLFAARAAVLEDLGLADEAADWRRRAEIAADALGHTIDEDEFDVIEIDDADTEEVFEDPEDARAELGPEDSDSQVQADEPAGAEELKPEGSDGEAQADEPADEPEAAGEPETEDETFTVEDEVEELLAEVDAAPEQEKTEAPEGDGENRA